MMTGTDELIRRQEDVIEEFNLFSDWSEKYEYLIDLGKVLPPLADQYHTDAYLVKGCQSKVWLHADVEDGCIILHADSDAIITKGIIALLIRVLSGLPAEDVAKADLFFIESIGLQSHLSPTRSNGLKSMIQHIRSYARHFSPATEDHQAPDDGRKARMIDVIKTVYDPEIPVDIWELGLIYDLDVDDNGLAKVTMTLTSPACPVAESLPMEVQQRLLDLDFVKDVELNLVWQPAWNKDKMSDVARMALDMF